MKKKNYLLVALFCVALAVFSSCATTGGVDYAVEAAQGVDVFAGKNWNAPRRNNMYDRWEFNTDGTFHFRHIHHGEPLDRGVYRYELKDGVITIAKEGAGESAAYTYVFSGNAVTLTPFHHAPEHEDAEPGAAEYHGEGDVSAEHADSGEHHGMGALLESPVTFTHAR